jgi:hypothetical protein
MTVADGGLSNSQGVESRESAMRSRTYQFHRAGGVVWALVFEPVAGRWYIEKSGRGTPPVRLTLAEFEMSDHGRRLSESFGDALREAESDA